VSGLALGWARKRRDAPSREAKSCLMYLADNCNEQIAFPSKRTLAEDMMCSEKTVMRLLQDLVSAGLLVRLDVEERATKRTRTCGYYFPIQGRPPTRDEVAVFEREIGGRVTLVSPWEGDTGVPLEGDTGVPLEGDTCVTGRVTTVSPLYEPPLEPSGSEEPSPGARAREALVSEIEQAMPRRMVAVSDQVAYREALETLAEQGVDLAVLPGCLRRWEVDPLFVSRKVPVPLERWLSSGMWRGSLPDAAVAVEAPEPRVDHPLWPRLLEAARPYATDGEVGSYLEPAMLAERAGAAWLVARTGTARDWIARKCWFHIREAWAVAAAGLDLQLISKSEFEALMRQGEA
jgi:hypothetical protein